jgi:hypothetical protein
LAALQALIGALKGKNWSEASRLSASEVYAQVKTYDTRVDVHLDKTGKVSIEVTRDGTRLLFDIPDETQPLPAPQQGGWARVSSANRNYVLKEWAEELLDSYVKEND